MGDLIEVRATINLPRLRAGELALVDPDHPYVADALQAGYLERYVSAVEPSDGAAMDSTEPPSEGSDEETTG